MQYPNTKHPSLSGSCLLQLLNFQGKEEERITYVPDRAFNDLRYTINSDNLLALGWKEEVKKHCFDTWLFTYVARVYVQ